MIHFDFSNCLDSLEDIQKCDELTEIEIIDVADTPPTRWDQVRLEPNFSEMHQHGLTKLTMTTGKIIRAFQEKGSLTIDEIVERKLCDRKRAYDILNIFLAVGFVKEKNPVTKEYIIGWTRVMPTDIHNLSKRRSRAIHEFMLESKKAHQTARSAE